MSFPPCMSRLASWVSHKQMAPGVSSLSTEDGTESWLPCGRWSGCHPKGSGTTGILEYMELVLPVWTLAGFFSLGDANITVQICDGKGPEPLI